MCTVLFACNYHPKYKLVVAANRDEYYDRPALAAGFWLDYPDILAGKDLREGGTWMGITTAGRFAVLTNFRDPATYKPNRLSRGHLVQNYLCGHLDPESYIEQLEKDGADYNGFNLLFGTCDSLYYYSNREKRLRKIDSGIHGLSNSLLDVPWPKVTKGKKVLAEGLQNEDITAEFLFAMMADREQPEDSDLPRTGVSLEWERILAPVFVMSPKYGTRTTTLLLVDRDNNVRFWERTFRPATADMLNEVYYEFKIGHN